MRSTTVRQALLKAAEILWQDVRFAARSLRKHRSFSAVAILTLALGIGANTAVFSVVRGTLLRPLPFPDSERVVRVLEVLEGGGTMAVSGGNFLDWRESSSAFEAMGLHADPMFDYRTTVVRAGSPARVQVSLISDGFLDALGVHPSMGRGFTIEERTPGGPQAILVSDEFWRSNLLADRDVIGSSLQWEGKQVTIVGVMPPGFRYPAGADLWVPMEQTGIITDRTAHNYVAIGRLAAGISEAQAETDLSNLTVALRRQGEGPMDAVGVRVDRLQETVVGDLRRPLLLLFGASTLVLLLGCANLASTFLARGAARQQEVATRTALGASRLRLVRQLLTEALVLSLIGAVVGLGLAVIMLRVFLAVGPENLAAAGSWGLDGSVLGFALTCAVATALIFGLLPALRASDRRLGSVLRNESRGNTGALGRQGWGGLIALEMALAILLLIGAGLFLRSFRAVLAVDPGFRSERVLTADISLPAGSYPDDPSKLTFYQDLLTELQSLPGVEAVGVIQHLPLGGIQINGGFEVEGREIIRDVQRYAGYRVASAGYFEAMQIPLLRGRLFSEADRASSGDVALISQLLAERIWPGEDPIGKRIRDLTNDSWVYPDRWITIIGVVGNVRHGTLLSQAQPEVYVHLLQRPQRAESAVVTIRTSRHPEHLIGPIRAGIHRVDPDVPADFVTMNARMLDSVADRRFMMLVLGAFAALALLLAAVGIYGVVSYSVARRTRELGIRLALGADPKQLQGMVQRSVMLMTLGGAAAGVVGALALAGALRGVLYGVDPADPLTIALVVLVLAGTAWISSYLPARRTTRVDPTLAMRAE